MPVALAGSGLGAFVTLRPYLGRCFGLDELLEHELHRTADEIERIAVFQHGGDLIEGPWFRAIGFFSFGVELVTTHRKIPDGLSSSGPNPYQKPTTRGDSIARRKSSKRDP